MKQILLKSLAALAAICCISSAWAADAPTITVDGTTVTINNETATAYDSSKTLTVNATWQSKKFWLPTGTGLESDALVKVNSIAFAVPSTGNFVDKIGLAGSVSASAVRTAGGFTTANADKVLFSFEECYLRAGNGTTLWFLDSNGEKVATSTVLNFTLGGNSNQYIDNLGWTINSVFYTPVIEVVGEIMAGSYITGAQTAIGNSGTDPLYAFGVTGWLDTANSKTGPVVLVGNNDGTASIGVNNANSVNANGQHSTWSKLSGSGTLTSLYTSTVGDKSSTSPVLEIYDSSEFTGSIVTPVSQGPKLSVVFCNSSESDTLKTYYNSLFHHNGGSNPASIYVSAGRTTANNAVVTIPANKTWTANKLLNNGEVVVDGTFTGPVANTGTLTVNGTVTGAISNNGGTVTVNAGATISSFGATRDFTGITVDSSIPVKITMTAEEYGKGTVSVTGANGISSITVFAPDGTTEVTTLTPDNGEATYDRGSVLVSGKACWYAWEMNGNLDGSGANTAGLSHDTGSSDQNAFYNSSMLYTYRHPYTTVAFPATWTAVVRCTVPKVVNGTVITFGTKFTSFIGLIAGDDPETEMKLVRYNSGDEEYTVLASMPIVDGTSAQHVYVFSVENNSHVTVYCDGSVALDDDFDTFTLGSGIQIGSAHGGVAGGLVRMWAGDTYDGLTTADLEEARIDCVRLYDYSLSAEQVAALSTEFPSVTIYRATVEDEADTTWGDLSWEPSWTGGNSLSKVILTTEGNATVALPETITADQIQLSLAADSTLTLTGPGSLTVTEPIDIGNGTLELTGTVTLTRNTAFNGTVKFTEFTKAGDGAIQLSNGATVGVDAELVVTALGTYTCAEGTVVDSSYTSDGVKLIPLTSAKISVTQSGTTLYYSDHEAVLVSMLQTPEAFAEDTVATLLNDATLPTGFDAYLQMYGYYIDGAAITKAVAQISSFTYPTLAAAVAAAADGATVKLLRASSEEITLNDKAITLDETANFSGTLTGNGTLTFKAFRNNPDITFDNWEGTIVLPEFAANGTILNKYGVTDSKVVLKGITSGWFNETSSQKMDVNPVLQLDGNVTIKGFSTSWDYTFAEITGTGTFALDPTDNHPKSATITKVAEDFSGIITNNTDKVLTITTLAREAGTSTDVGTKLLDIGGTGEIVVGAVTIGGEPADVYLVYEEDGVYVGVPPVAAVYDGETLVGNFASLADAIDAAEAGQKVVLLAATAEDVTVNKVVVVEAGDYAITGTITVTADGATVTLLNEPTLGANTWILGRDTVTGVITVGYGLTCELVIVCSGLGDVTPTTPTGIGVREGTANTWEVLGGTEVTLTATPGTDYSGYEYRVDGGSYTVMGDSEQYNLVFVNNVATITVNGYTHASVTFVVREQEFTIPASAHMVVDRVYKSGEFETVYEPDPETGKYSITQGTTIVVRYTPIEGYIVMPDGYYEYDLEVTAETTTVDNTSAEAAATKVVAKIDETPYTSLVEAVIAATDGDTVTLLADATLPQPMYTLNQTITLNLNGNTLSAEGDTAKTAKLLEVVGGKTLTVVGTTAGSTVYGRINVGSASQEGNLVIQGGYYEVGAQTVVHVNGNRTNSSVSITGATIVSTADNGIQLNGAGTHTITDTSITGATAVYLKAGSLAISGATTLTATGDKGPVTEYNNGSDPTGDALVIDNCTPPYQQITGVTIASTVTLVSANASAINVNARSGCTRQTKFVPAAVKANITEAVATEADVFDDYSAGIDPTDPDSEQEVTPTAEEIEAAGGSAEAAAIAKAEVTAPTGVDAATYKENFELRAEPNGDGSYTVTIVGFDPQMETDVAESAAEALEEESPTVEVPAGLYYKIETLSALNGTDEDPKTGMSNGTAIPVTKPTGTTQGFIRVRIGTAEITD